MDDEYLQAEAEQEESLNNLGKKIEMLKNTKKQVENSIEDYKKKNVDTEEELKETKKIQGS